MKYNENANASNYPECSVCGKQDKTVLRILMGDDEYYICPKDSGSPEEVQVRRQVVNSMYEGLVGSLEELMRECE